ncbi:MAG: methyltransferase domain-containing protein, partial [Pseudomonadota bacterium]
MSSDSAIAEKKVREMASLTTGDSIGADVGMWSFAGETSEKFEAHVAKSVPLYLQGHDLVCKLSEFFVHPDSLIYEIGCSTAVLSRKLAEHHNKKSIRIVGIDIEPDMIARARSKCEAYDNIDLTSADAAHFEFEKSDLIVAYYTLQFVPPKKRQVLISALYNALNWGGALMMFEKT